jgi:hypothetical protein
MARILHGILACALLASMAAAPTLAIGATATKKEVTKTETKKELTPQQQKMKDCSTRWGEEKKAKKVSGKKAHGEFMSRCLKG